MKLDIEKFEILDSYTRRGKSASLKVKLFESNNEDINRYGVINIKIDSVNIYESLLSYEYGYINLSINDILSLENKILKSVSYNKALKSYKKK